MRDYKIIEPSSFESDENFLKWVFNNSNDRLLDLTNMKDKLKIGFNVNISNNRISSMIKEGQEDSYEIAFPISLYKDIQSFYIHIFNSNNAEYFSSISNLQKWNETDAGILRNIMLQISVNFFILHELGHVYNGHLSYLYQKVKVDDEIRKILEMNADDFASTQTLSMFAHPNIVKELNKKMNIDLSLGNLGLIIFSSIIIAISMTSLGKKGWKGNNKYLPLRLREFLILNDCIEIFDLLNYETNNFTNEPMSNFKDEIFLLASKDENLVNDYLNKITTTHDYSIENNIEFLSQEYMDMYQDLQKPYFENIPKLLKPYSYMPEVIKFI